MINNVEANERTKSDTVKELIDTLKELPEARQAYLNGVAAGMAAERRIALASADTRSA